MGRALARRQGVETEKRWPVSVLPLPLPGSLREEANEGTGKGWLAWWGGSRPQGGCERVAHNPAL